MNTGHAKKNKSDSSDVPPAAILNLSKQIKEA